VISVLLPLAVSAKDTQRFAPSDSATGAVVAKGTLPTGSLTTTFAGGNNFNGNSFDLTPSVDLTIDSFDVHMGPPSPRTVSVYWRTGTANGREGNSSGWNLLGSAVVTPQGPGVPTPVPVGGLSLTAGTTYGIIVYSPGTLFYYTNGASTYSNADLSLTTFRGLGDPLFSSNLFSPRAWNGTVYYTVGGGGGFACGDLAPVVGDWGLSAGRCGNFTSTTTTARYETAIFESSLPQTRGSAPGEYAYEVELVNNRPRQPSASTSIFVAGSPYPLRTATQNWDRAIAFNISGAGKYSVFRYNGSGLPVALQKWVFPAGVTINAAPASNVLRVERVSAGAGFNLRFFINGVFVRELADTLGVDQFGTGFVRSLATTGNLVTDDWMEVLDITLDALPENRGRVIQEISRAQQRANDAANASRGNDNPLFESTPDRR